MLGGERDSVLHFSCDSCGTHLGFDDSLAGLQAPCPKCGSLVTAPQIQSRQIEVPSSGVTRGVSPGESFRPVEQVRGPSVRRRRSGGGVYPASGRLATEDEKENLSVLLKILGAIAMVLLVVVFVAWYLRR